MLKVYQFLIDTLFLIDIHSIFCPDKVLKSPSRPFQNRINQILQSNRQPLFWLINF